MSADLEPPPGRRGALARLWPRKIRHQLIAGVALVHLLLMTVFVVDLVERQRRFLRTQSLEQTQALASTLAVNSSSWVLANDVVGLGEVVHALRRYPGVRYAMVVARDGRVLAHTQAGRRGTFLSDGRSLALLRETGGLRTVSADDDLIDVAAPILANGGACIGWARVGMGQGRISDSLAAVARNGVLYTLLAILLGSAFAVLIGSRLTAGLSGLLTMTREVRDGRRDVRTRTARGDEVGELGHGLDEMLDALTAEEERVRLLLDSTMEGILGVDLEGRCTFCNPAALSLLGYARPDDLLGQPLHERIHHHHRDGSAYTRAACPTFDLERAGTESLLEGETYFRADGTSFLAESRARPIFKSGRRVGIVITLSDITERRRAEEDLRRSEERFHETLDRMLEGCMIVGLDWTYLYVNEAAARHGRRRREELIGRKMVELYPGVEGSEVFRRYRRCMTERVPDRFPSEFRFPDGTTSAFEFSVTPVAEGIFILSLDVTERKKAEDALRRSEEKHRLFFELDLAGHFASTPEGKLLTCNPSFARMLGFSSVEDAMSETNILVYSNPEEQTRFLEVLKAKGRVERHEKELRRRDGRLVHVLENAVGTFDERGALLEIRGIVIDETGRREAERELRQVQKMEAVGRLAGGVAHDFNNILMVILGYLEILEPGMAGDPRLAELKEIRAAAERAASLTRQLLAFSRRQVLRPTLLDLNGVVAEMEKMLRRLIGEDIRIETVLAPEAAWVLADASQVEQVILNLAVNARDAMPHGGALILETAGVDPGRARAELGPAAPEGPYVLLSVSDTGCGIDAEAMAHLFEPFFTTKERGKGTGLGLAMVYGIVMQSGGFLKVESEPGRGSTFRVFLPRASGDGARVDRAGAGAEPPPRGTETILLAEDDAALRGMATALLVEAGYTVLPVGGGEEALERVAAHPGPIHLLLSDVIMPGMSGPELARRLLAVRPGAAVLFMSGYTDASIAPHGVLEPGIQLLQKPFDRTSLLLKIRGVLARTAGQTPASPGSIRV